MHPLELSLLLQQALEPRVGRLLELTGAHDWWEHVEPLHDARVASRRLRAVLRLLDPGLYPGLKRQQRRLEALTEILGSVRELDVHTQILEEMGPELPGPQGWAALEHVLEGLEIRRSKARKRLSNQIKGLELAKVATLLAAPELPYPFHPQEPIVAAWGLLNPHLETMAALVPELQRNEDPAGLHQLRIHAKKLRYALEILAPIFLRKAEAPLKELKALQTVLGDHHDYAVLEAGLQSLQEGLELRGRQVLTHGLQEILLRLARERATQYDRFREIADLFTPPGFSRELHSRLGLAGDRA